MDPFLTVLVALLLGVIGGGLRFFIPPVEDLTRRNVVAHLGAGAFVGAFLGTPILLQVELSLGNPYYYPVALSVIAMGYFALDVVGQILADRKPALAQDGGTPSAPALDRTKVMALGLAVPSIALVYWAYLTYVGGDGWILGTVMGAILSAVSLILYGTFRVLREG